MFLLDLIDIFRELKPNLRQYTWRKFNTSKQGRLDYFLISNALVPYVADTDISPGYRTDHSSLALNLMGNHIAEENLFGSSTTLF